MAGRPRGTPQSPEARAKISASSKRLWRDRREFMLAVHAKDAPYRTPEQRARISATMTKLPLVGTPERRLYDKMAKVIGYKAARAEIARSRA